MHRGLHRGSADKPNALEQRAHVVDLQHRVLAAALGAGKRPPRALLNGALESIASNS